MERERRREIAPSAHFFCGICAELSTRFPYNVFVISLQLRQSAIVDVINVVTMVAALTDKLIFSASCKLCVLVVGRIYLNLFC